MRHVEKVMLGLFC